MKRVICDGQKFVILNGHRIWTEAPPDNILPDLLHHANPGFASDTGRSACVRQGRAKT